MKIKTESVTKFSNVINRAYSNSNSIHQLVLLDFENEKAYMKSTNGIHISFDITVEGYDESICDRLITNASKFLSVCNMYEELEVISKEDKILFSSGNNEFQLSSFEDTQIIPTQLFDLEYESEARLVLNEDLVKAFKKSATYLSKDDNSNEVYRHVFVEDETMVVMSEEFNILITAVEGVSDCKIYRDVLDYVNIINSLSDDIILDISDKNYILKSKGVKVISPLITNGELPEVLSDEFMDFCSHETSFTVDKVKLLNFLTSVKPFTNELVNNSLYFTMKDNQLTLATKGNDKIKVDFEVNENIGLTEDFTFIFEGNFFARNIKNMEGETVTIEVGNEVKENKGQEKEAVLCFMYSEKDKEKLVFKRLSER